MADIEGEADAEVIRLVDIQRFVEVLNGTGFVLEAVAKWLEDHGVDELPGAGLPTARRGCGYLGNFISTAVAGYHEVRMRDGLKELDPGVIVKASATEAMGKGLARMNEEKKPKKAKKSGPKAGPGKS